MREGGSSCPCSALVRRSLFVGRVVCATRSTWQHIAVGGLVGGRGWVVVVSVLRSLVRAGGNATVGRHRKRKDM